MAILALAALLLPLAAAVPCVQFDTSWNLYAFGGSYDVNLGQNTTWSSPSAKNLTTTGRPPWTGNYTQCFLSQDNNAMYVLGADSSDLSKIYVYDFSGDSWSAQTTSSAPSNLGNSRSASILDHDTNVIYTLTSGSGASLYSLSLENVKASASSSSIGWENAGAPSWASDSYVPTAAPAANHINYFGVSGVAAGSADIFVIHYNYWQPDAQAYNGTAFPDSAGQAFAIPEESSIPYQMVFIPNDFSQSYVVTHWTDLGNYAITSDAPFATSLINSTQTLSAPSSQDSAAAYAASPYNLVQVDSTGALYYVSNPRSGFNVNSDASWTKLDYTLAGLSSSSSSSSSSASASGSATASGSSSTGSTQASGSSSGGSSAATSSSKSAASSTIRFDIMGVAAGLVAVGAALVL